MLSWTPAPFLMLAFVTEKVAKGCCPGFIPELGSASLFVPLHPAFMITFIGIVLTRSLTLPPHPLCVYACTRAHALPLYVTDVLRLSPKVQGDFHGLQDEPGLMYSWLTTCRKNADMHTHSALLSIPKCSEL